MLKMSARSIPNYPANLTILAGSWIFGCPKRLLWSAAAPKRDMMWHEILRPSFFLAYCASFMSRWLLLGGKVGLYIRSDLDYGYNCDLESIIFLIWSFNQVPPVSALWNRTCWSIVQRLVTKKVHRSARQKTRTSNRTSVTDDRD